MPQLTTNIENIKEATKKVMFTTRLMYRELTHSDYLVDLTQLGLNVKTIRIGFRMVFAVFSIFLSIIMLGISFTFVGYNRLDELHAKLEERIVSQKASADFSDLDTNQTDIPIKETLVLDLEKGTSQYEEDYIEEKSYFNKVNKLVYEFKDSNSIHNINHMDITKGENLKKVLALNSRVAELFLVEFAKIEKLPHVQEFYQKDVIEAALMEQLKYGIPASITLAQAADESSYGRSSLAKSANNFFGIKYNKGDKQDHITYYTHEELTEKDYAKLKDSGRKYEFVGKITHKGSTYYKVKLPSEFRKYESWWHSFRDHSEFLAKRPGYQKIFANNGNWRQWVEMFRPQNLGGVPYATSTSKSVRLGRIIERYKFYLLDVY